ncbi:hypothetical protein D9M72_296240 [compost metagenome]
MSGPCPETTEVWMRVSSSLAEAKVSNFTSAPVSALNLAAMSLCHFFCCSGYWLRTPTRTLSVLPVPSTFPSAFVELPVVPAPAPQPVNAKAAAVTIAASPEDDLNLIVFSSRTPTWPQRHVAHITAGDSEPSLETGQHCGKRLPKVAKSVEMIAIGTAPKPAAHTARGDASAP